MSAETCQHTAWRYPAPLPSEGDVCRTCRATYHEPATLRPLTLDDIEEAQGKAEILAVIIDEAQGKITANEATRTIRELCAVHGWAL